MERELWPLLYRELVAADAEFRQTYVTYPPAAVAAVLLWAAVHDRPVGWACDPRNWATTALRPPRRPSPATVSRRARRTAFALFLSRLTDRRRGAGSPGLVLVVDGKPLLVGGNSHDPDAAFGRAAGHIGRGYKLHAVWGLRRMPEAWAVTPLNANEATVAEGRVGRRRGGGYLLADAGYDAGRPYDRAAACGYQLVAQPKAPGAGRGHRRQSRHRLRGIELQGTPFGRDLFRRRPDIERRFGNATAFAGGLTAPPAWVRRQGRVERWVWATLAINAARIRRLEALQMK